MKHHSNALIALSMVALLSACDVAPGQDVAGNLEGNTNELPSQTNEVSQSEEVSASEGLSFSRVHEQVIQPNCVNCHVEAGIAGASNLIFNLGSSEEEFNNKDAFICRTSRYSLYQ